MMRGHSYNFVGAEHAHAVVHNPATPTETTSLHGVVEKHVDCQPKGRSSNPGAGNLFHMVDNRSDTAA